MVQAQAATSDKTGVGSPPDKAAARARTTSQTWAIRVATFLGFALPALAYLWMIQSYGVNIIFADQWDDVVLVGHAYSGNLHLSTLWAQHYENRLFFPNLIVLALAYTTHLNVVTEEYLGAFMAFGATALVILAHKRRSPGRRWIWYCPVAFLLLSLAQAPNALWGFQMAWYLVLLMVALALFFLDRPTHNPLTISCAIAAGVVASFSSLQGLLVWPAGLLLIYLRRRQRFDALVWITGAVVTGTIYFVGFNFNTSQSPSQDAFGFFLRVLGDIVGDGSPGAWEVLLGAALVMTAIWSFVRFGTRRFAGGGRPIGLALVAFALLFAALTSYGRSGVNVVFGNVEQRYTVFAVLMLVGLYLVVLDPIRSSEEPQSRVSPEGRITLARFVAIGFGDPAFAVARAVVGVAIVLTVVIGTINGVDKARSIRDNRIYLGKVTVRANRYPNVVVGSLDWLETPASVRARIATARRLHLSLFGTGDSQQYLHTKQLNFYASAFRASVALPRRGSTLHGRVLLDVFISDPFDVSKIDYLLTSHGLSQSFVTRATNTSYGWLSGWDTRTAPNGTYTLTAVVSDSGGRMVRTQPVEVKIDNG